MEDIAGMYGFSSKLVSMRTVPGRSLDFAAQEEGLAEVMLVQTKMAVEVDGADSIIGYGIIDHLREQLDVPVISPV